MVLIVADHHERSNIHLSDIPATRPMWCLSASQRQKNLTGKGNDLTCGTYNFCLEHDDDT